ncbi:conserved hypothetical protein [Vibrio chagasii]|nr:conserved hypothetical protein [Vibrio chagasii]
MSHTKLFIVSNWESYSVAEAKDHQHAIERVYFKKNYRMIPNRELNEFTVTHAMCCEYNAVNRKQFSKCKDEAAIVLLIDELAETRHFQLTKSYYA